MCKTRSTESDLAYEHFYLVLPFIVEGLEIGYFEKTFIGSWDYKNKMGSNVVFKCFYFFAMYYSGLSLIRTLRGNLNLFELWRVGLGKVGHFEIFWQQKQVLPARVRG